jgi:hypothetical protein
MAAIYPSPAGAAGAGYGETTSSCAAIVTTAATNRSDRALSALAGVR